MARKDTLTEPERATTQVMSLDSIRPYWRNPRVVSDDDIQRVSESIERYGYQAPIIVDRDGVVIIGHTRLAAIRRLGWTEIEVIVADLPADKANEYRLIDNRTHEYTSWDREALLRELAQFTDSPVLINLFPTLDFSSLTELNLDAPRPTGERHAAPTPQRTLTCPHCYHTFEWEKPRAMDEPAAE